MRSTRTPADLARRLATRSREKLADPAGRNGTWRRQTFRLPRDEARETARDWFERYPKAAYLTEIESWQVLDGDLIEFTMRRLPTAD